MHAFNGPTDGQTGTFLIASPHWHSMQYGKIVTNNMPLNAK